jgi:hypothetical protein
MGVRDTIAKAVMGIKAYHSSPHDFDKFDLKKIGTGEGAQVYGHGLYFAENPAVSGQGGQYWNQFSRRFEGPEKEAASYLKAQQFDRQKAIEALRTELADEAGKNYPDFARRQETLRLLESGAPVGPRTYEVNIKADPAHFLDWDKPFASPDALEAFAARFDAVNPTTRRFLEDYSYANTKAGRPLPDGEDIVRELKGIGDNRVQFAREFADAGIPGIKYLDEGSRPNAAAITRLENTIKNYEGPGKSFGDLEGWQKELERAKQVPLTNNYVVFDPANIDILKKYGVAAAPTGALAADQMGSTFDQRYYGAQP